MNKKLSLIVISSLYLIAENNAAELSLTTQLSDFQMPVSRAFVKDIKAALSAS